MPDEANHNAEVVKEMEKTQELWQHLVTEYGEDAVNNALAESAPELEFYEKVIQRVKDGSLSSEQAERLGAIKARQTEQRARAALLRLNERDE